MASKAKNVTDGVKRIREEDRLEMDRLVDARDDATEKKNRAEIAVAQAQVEFQEFNRRMMKRYKLGTTLAIMQDGRIVPAPPSQQPPR